MTISKRVAVVGGGISGLAAAYELYKSGFHPEIFEAGSRLGGRVAPRMLGDRSIAIGGKNIGKNYRLFRSMTNSLGVDNYEYFGLNTSRIVDGEIESFDSKSKLKGYVGYLKHASLKDIARITPMIASVKQSRKNGDLGGPFFKRYSGSETNKVPTEYFSEDFIDNFIRPMVIRMNGAEPDTVSIANLGSNLQVIMDSYEQLVDGFCPLLDKFSELMPVHLNTKVENVTCQGNKITGIETNQDGQLVKKDYDHVVLATTANISSDIVSGVNQKLSNLLGAITYNPVAVVVAHYEKNVFNSAQRAIVFPKNSALSNAGAYGVNDLNLVRYTFSGEKAQEMIANGASLAELLANGEEQLNRYFSLADNKCNDYVGEIMRVGLCSYAFYHHDFLDNLSSCVRDLEGFSITGDFIYGASIENCMRSAKEAVAAICDTRAIAV